MALYPQKNLPAYLFIAVPQTDSYVLVHAEQKDGIWRMNAIRSPKEFVHNAQSAYLMIDVPACKYMVNLCSGETYIVTMCKKGRYLSMPGHGSIYQYDMGLVYNILGVEPLANPAWHFKMCDTAPMVHVAPALPDAASIYLAKIPQHVFRRFIECAIREKEECPITTDTLTVDMVGAPPCGHLFDKVALKTVLEQYGCCPTCRSPAQPDGIQGY